MKKNLILSTLLISTSLMAMPDAKQMRDTTDKATKVAVAKLLEGKEGQEVYNGVMSILEKNITRIAEGGFYDTLTITYMNAEKYGHEKLLRKLKRQETDILRQKIIKDLEDKGYKITLNRFWNNPNALNISISW